ncbi:MAG: efflux RND transporter periplasmic adaptor subunit [Steroidobacteraceae bacterium]
MIETHDPSKPLPSEREPVPQLKFSPAKLRRIGLVAAAIALLIAIIGIADREVKEHAVARWTVEQAIPSVAVVIPGRGEGAASGDTLDLPGDIAAWNEAPMYARVSGYLKQWNVDYGAHVKKGQVLATIETPDLDAQYAAAQADLDVARAKVNVAKAAMEFAKTTYDRWRDSPKGVVSLQETEAKKADYETGLAGYDAALAGVKSDQGVVDRLNALERFKNLVAPFDGVVTVRNTDIGDLINAGSGPGSALLLFKVADVHEMRVFVQVPQAMSGGITPGMTAELTLPQYPERVFTAVVATTASAINPTSRALLVELHASNPDDVLQPGTYAQVRFNVKANPNILTIPATALIFQQAGMQVAVVGPGNRAQLKAVTLGRNFGTDVVVLTGLSPSDRVINSPPDSLTDGEAVSVVNPSASSGGELAGGR